MELWTCRTAGEFHSAARLDRVSTGRLREPYRLRPAHEQVVPVRLLDEDDAIRRLELPVDVLAERDLDVVADVGRDGLLVGSLRDHHAARWRGRGRRPAGYRDAAARGDNGRERYSEQTNLHVA